MAEESDKGPREIVRFEGIVVNPSGTGGSRFLSTTVALEVFGAEARAAVEQAEPMIKDALITHLSSRTIEQLTDAEQRELMREALLKRINPIVKPHKVKGVYFLDFVLQ
jgi:flagellar FliL protein